MQVIRIEHHEDGNGLWRSHDDSNYRIRQHSQYEAIKFRHQNREVFPTFYNDMELLEQFCNRTGRSDPEGYFFSFNSLEIVNEALTPDEFKEAINDLGFKVYLLELSDCIQSSFQTVFKKENIVSKKDISFMFK